jgi:hypothetical protein
MAGFEAKGMVLRWQRRVIEHLLDTRPANHTSVIAVAAVLIVHADPDGSKVFPGQVTIARAAGLHPSTVAFALEFLERAGLIEFVRFRARGLKEYQLQIADGPMSDQIAGHPVSGSDRGSDRGSDLGSSETTSVTSVTSREDFTKERAGVGCSNCERVVGHDPDCSFRPFGDLEVAL